MDFTPTAWLLWLFAALLLGALEVQLTTFMVLWFAVGALAASIGAALGLGLHGQLFLFIAISGALFAASRTLFKNVFMRDATHLKTGTEAMIGQEAVVVESLGESHGGTVRINGELWTARWLSGPVPEGERVTVEQIEGLKLWVRRPTASMPVPVGDSKKEESGWNS